MVQVKSVLLISAATAVSAVAVFTEQPDVISSIESIAYRMAEANGVNATKLFTHLMSDISEFVDQVIHPILTIPASPTVPAVVPTVPIPFISFPTNFSIVPNPTLTRPTVPPVTARDNHQLNEKRALINLASELAEFPYHKAENINVYSASDDDVSASAISSAGIEADPMYSSQNSPIQTASVRIDSLSQLQMSALN